MAWPGAPKSASSPPINTPSTRYPVILGDNPSTAQLANAVRTLANGLTVHEQAFANLPSQISTQASAAATTAVENITSETVVGVDSFNTLTGAVIYFPGLGTVNDQLGVTSYAVQQTDAGAKIIVGDSSAVSIYLDSGLAAPWFAIIDNDSSSTATLIPQIGTLYGEQFVYPGGFGIVVFDGSNWWSGATPKVSGYSGTITTAKLATTNGSMTFANGLLVSQVQAT